ncbi:MAG TPA: hypothetical protein VFE24_15325 [Pirellulales bacterium]|jgi:hypothetical protein|nr:hypothetical protein [Pirellulales bacterium]
MSIAFEELEQSPQIAVENGRLAARRLFLIAWDDWPGFVQELYGSHAIVGGTPVFTPPAAFPDQPNLIVERVQVDPFPADRPTVATLDDLATATNRYPFARVTADYRFVPAAESRLPTVPDGTIVEYASDLAAEYLLRPGRTWRWRATPDQTLPDDVAPGLLVPCEDLHLRWSRVPLPPWTAIRAARGWVNDDDFLGNATGTVLFLGAHVRRDFQVIDTGLWYLDLHFKVKEPGWNYAFKADAGWQIIEDQSSQTPYQEADFTALFAFGS